MDEGLTTFFTTLVAEDYWDSDRSVRQAFLQYRSSVRRGSDAVCMTHADHFAPRSGAGMGFASYAKPSAVFHQLRAMVGKERFMEAIRTYTDSWAFAHPYPYDLFNTFSTVVGENLDWYFRTWFYEAWSLDHAVKEVAATEDHSMVTIADLGLAPAPAEVRVTYASGEQETRTIPVTHWLQGERLATLKFGPGVRKVEIDPSGITLDVDPDNNRWSRR
jgi:aminopeptidase N